MTLASQPSVCPPAEEPLLFELQPQELFVARARAGLEQDLQHQYARLSNGRGCRLTSGDPTAHLAASITRSLVEAGFEIHDCAAKARTGGVCLTPTSRQDGVIVTWTTHHALRVDPQRHDDDQAAHEVMNYALYDTLMALGWDVREYGHADANLVVGRQAIGSQEVTHG